MTKQAARNPRVNSPNTGWPALGSFPGQATKDSPEFAVGHWIAATAMTGTLNRIQSVRTCAPTDTQRFFVTT